jgi:glycosyltransferase involved in cell wall biosynthesis
MHGLEWKRSRWSSFGRSVLRNLEVLSMRGHGAYTAVSKQQCEHFGRAYGIDFTYIPTGTEVRSPTPPRLILEKGLEPDRYVLFASRLVREKGAPHLVDAFRDLETDCKLVIAGEAFGEEAYRDELARAAEGDARILFVGHVEGELLEELFSNAAIYVQPSEIEGLSIALLEAMGHARCCVVSDIAENVEAIGDTGVTFRQGSSADLADKLAALLGHRSTRAARGAAARERVQKLFTWDHVADAFEMLYSEVLAK